MHQPKIMKKCLSWLIASALSVSAMSGLFTSTQPISVSAAETGSRILVDINKNDGRKASYSKVANNWIVDNTYTYTVNGITCKLSSGGSGSVDLVNNKILQLQDIEKTPTLTMDGAKIKDGSGNPSLKLELSGLSNGTHSIKTIHACADRNVTNSSLTIKINGKTVATGVKCPTSPADSNDAGTAYGTFSGTSATVEIIAEGNGSLNTPWLNGFEIDGADPVNSISRIYPADQEKHFVKENGLSWTAGKNAASHNVYIGTDFSAVQKASTSSPEFKGNVKESKFALDDSYSSVPVYYWRVDEVNQDGSVVTGAVYSFQTARLAFPTAEGYGRYARGGRGGYVYHVTNLNDSGEGSLRYGVENLTGARTIVFDVGGIIELKSKMTIPEEGGDVYIAGQTAPGDGITLTKWGFGMIGCNDVIVRDVRVRVGDRGLSGVNDVSDGMGLSSCNHCIIDHCSIAWATDEGFSSRSAANITVQWNIIAESLNNSIHYDANDRTKTERHAFAGSISGFTGSFHHNLLVNNTGRNWSMAGGMEQDGVTYGGQLDISNNVVYNWRDRTTDGGVHRLNFVNNYYKAGAVSNTALHVVSIDGNELNTSDMQKMYVSGNVMTDSKGGFILKASDDAWAAGKAKSGGKNSTDNDVRSNSPFFENYINLETAENAYQSVTSANGAGARFPSYDYLDSRYLKEVTTGTYTYTGSKDGLNGIIDSQNDVGGYPTSSNFKGGTAKADTDGDGMPDEWENAHGLNLKDASDGAIVSLSADDYTNLELYLNELAGDDVAFNGNVKTIDAFSKIEAESFDAQEGIKTQECSDTDGGEQVAYVENGDYLLFKNVDFGDGAKSFTARLAGNTADIEVYLDSLNGSPAGTLHYTGAGNWTDWSDASCNVSATGKHDVYLKFTGGEGYLVNLNWVVFGKEALPINGTYFKNLTVQDTENDAGWSFAENLAVGSKVFGDRDFTFTELPKEVLGAEQILTACDSKKLLEGTAGTFEASEAITVYTAVDKRTEKTPEFLAEWTKTDLTAVSSNDVTFEIYQKNFSKGDTVTLGSNGQSAYCVNYTVFLTAQAKEEPTETEPLTEETTEQATEPAETEASTEETTTTESKSSKEPVYGDVNCDGEVDILDVITLNKSIMGKESLSEDGIINGDVNLDGKPDSTDALNILKLIVGIITAEQLPLK